MATKIPGVKIEQSKAEQHKEFMRDTLQQASECQGVTQYLPTLLAEFRTAVEFENQCLLRPSKSVYSKPIFDKDNERDAALGKLRAAMWAATGNPDANTAAAAKYLWDYSGIEKVSSSVQYDEQTGRLTTLLTKLLGEMLTYTEASGLKPYVTLLKRLNDEMCELLQLRDAEQGEQGEQGPSQLAEARTATDRAYRELIYGVNCLSFTYSIQKLVDQPDYDPFIHFVEFMLGLIARYNREVLNRKPGDKEETEEVEEEETVTDGNQTTTTEEEEVLTRK